jgi:hypothetical protein
MYYRAEFSRFTDQCSNLWAKLDAVFDDLIIASGGGKGMMAKIY